MRPKTRYFLDPARPFILRYGMAIAVTLWILLFLAPMGPYHGTQPFSVFLGAVALNAWYGGLGPGLLTAIAGVMAGVYLSEPEGQMAVGSDQLLQMGSYLIAALSIGAMADRRESAESFIRSSRDELETVLSCVADSVCAVTEKGRLLYRNEAAVHIAPMEAIVGVANDGIWNVFDEAGALIPYGRLPVQRVLAGADRADALLQAWDSKGTVKWYIARATVMPDPSSRERVAVCVVNDVTSMKEAEAERSRLLVAEQEARRNAERSASRLARLNSVSTVLSKALTPEQVADAVIQEGIAAFDASAGILLLLSDDRTIIRPVRVKNVPEPGGDQWVVHPVSMMAPTSVAIERQEIVWLKSREEMTTRFPDFHFLAVPGDGARVTVPLILDGAVLGVIHIILQEQRDGTDEDREFLWALAAQCALALERARLYKVECDARADAEHSTHAMDEFLAMLSHELRNPLNSVVSATTLLRRLRGADPDLIEALEILDVETRQITRLVNDLLDVSRITRGKITLQRMPCDLHEVVCRAVHCMDTMLMERRQMLTLTGPDGPVHVLADPARMEQVLGNLLNNASKYSDPGASIELSLEREDKQAVIRVCDHGIGIEPEFLPRVFDLFSQADRSLDRSGGGLGIGLTLVNRLVAMHGGTIEVASEGSGRGCVFTVRLPLLEQPIVTLDETAPPVARSQAPRRRVLVVDDNRMSANLLVQLLRDAGHEARSANDGETALALAPSFAPQIALLDIGLPGMDGYALAQAMAGLPSLAGLRLFALTGFGQPEDHQRTREAGFEAHLTKPVDCDTLLRLFEEPVPSR